MKIVTKLLIFAILGSCLSTLAQTSDRGVTSRPTSSQTGEKRLALVIGNSNYQFTGKLKNAVNDATDVTAALKNLGFEVISGTDLTLPQMRKLVREFGIKLQQQKGIGLFYFAGHGIQVGGNNYLIPVDANIETAVETSDYSLDSELVLRYLREAGNEINMVILDACRNNPFARSWQKYSPSRNIGDDKDLARITPPNGTVILYSTEPGSTALDGTGANGLFTESLLRQINKPNIEFDAMVKLLAKDVRQKSGGKQIPWKEGIYFGNFYFLSFLTDGDEKSNSSLEIESDKALWKQVEDSNNISDFEIYLNVFPDGVYKKAAEFKIKKLKDIASIDPVKTNITQQEPTENFPILNDKLPRILIFNQKYKLRGLVVYKESNKLVLEDAYKIYTNVVLKTNSSFRIINGFETLKSGAIIQISGRGDKFGNLVADEIFLK